MDNKRLLLFFLLLFGIRAYAQQQDELLAAQYFNEKEYTKATTLFEKIYNNGNQTIYIYDNLLACYFATQNYADAEKLVKKQIRNNGQNYFYQVDLGYVYEKWADQKRADKQYNALLNKPIYNPSKVVELANAFKKRNHTKLAIIVFLNSRKSLKSNDVFALELAQLYADENQTGPMLQEYLQAVIQNPELMEEVQGQMQMSLQQDSNYYEIKQTLIKLHKANPENQLYAEMLIWTFVQKGEFEQALIYAKSLDKRNKEQGNRIINLADLALTNQKYNAAAAAYQEVVLMGNNNPFYMQAKLGMLKTKTYKAQNNINTTKQEFETLVAEYNLYLTEFGKQPYTASTIADLANVLAYSLDDFLSAIKLYQELVAMPGLDERSKAQYKLALADLHLVNAEQWEAMLLYGQVDKAFLEDPLGQEAKFRNARLSYFLGEFEWAKAQLDVLKTATTQLIANNAIELLLTIQDNTIDSNLEPLKLFAQADLFCYQNKLLSSKKLLDSLEVAFPKHALTDDIIYKKAEICLKQKNYTMAAAYFEQVYKEHGSGILGDNALYNLGLLYELMLNNSAKASETYELFIEKYPGSFFLTDVRKRYRRLRGDCC